MASKPKRAALYLRVSTDGQTAENQRLALEIVCEQRGWKVIQVYSDNGVSGAEGRTQRPGCPDALLKDASRGGFDVVGVTTRFVQNRTLRQAGSVRPSRPPLRGHRKGRIRKFWITGSLATIDN